MSNQAKTTTTTVIPAMRYRDAPAAIDWLCQAFGFEKHLVVPGENGTIAHAQLSFGNGMIMLGSANDDDYGRLIAQPADIGGRTTQAPCGHPFGMLMVLALSGDERQSYLEGFLEGVRQAMSEYGIGLLGGDTKQTAGRSTTITIIDEAHRAGSLLRRGAEPGDKIFITPGEIGATLRSYVLAARMRKRKEIAQVIRPTAKLTFGQALANDRIATSCIDMSDGLLASAEQLGQLNGVIFRIDAQNVPYATSPTSVREVEWRDLLLNVGGDFGLMFTTKRSDVRFAESMGAYCIGEVIAAQAGGLRVVERDRLGIRFRGWEQFKTTEPISSDILSFV